MVILPTEKSFDWQHTPLVLIALVILNIMVFFFYQSGDGEKLENALLIYDDNELINIEWPLYRDFLLQQGKDDIVAEFDSYVDEGYGGQIAYSLLLDTEFNRHLNDNFRDLVPDQQYVQWSAARPMINGILESISFNRFALIPNQLNIVDLIAYQFLHGDVMHLIGNLFFLLVCGFAVEAAIGHWRFLGFYLVTGIVGGLSHALVDLNSGSPLVGASGSISGVMAMYLGVFRLRKIEFFYWFFVFVGYFRAPALLILPIYIGKELIDFFTSDGANVAYLAHAGGFIAGGLLITASLLINPQAVNEEYVEKDQTNNEYQEKLAKVYSAIENFQFTAALNHLRAVIEEYGLNFHLATLRYNLGKIHKHQEFSEWVTDLLSMKTKNKNDLAKLQTIWQDNPAIADQLDIEKSIDLGFRFSNKEQFTTAESIFKTVQNRTPKHPQLSLLAHKLSEVAKQLKQPGKHEAYLRFAKSNHGIQG